MLERMKWDRTRAWAVAAPSRRKSKRPWGSATTERSGGGGVGRGQRRGSRFLRRSVDVVEVVGDLGTMRPRRQGQQASKSGLFNRGSSATEEEVP